MSRAVVILTAIIRTALMIFRLSPGVVKRNCVWRAQVVAQICSHGAVASTDLQAGFRANRQPATKKICRVSLWNKLASLLGKFRVADRGMNMHEKIEMISGKRTVFGRQPNARIGRCKLP